MTKNLFLNRTNNKKFISQRHRGHKGEKRNILILYSSILPLWSLCAPCLRERYLKISSKKVFSFLLLLFLAFPVFAESPGPQSTKSLTLEETLSALGTAAELRWDPFFSSGALISGTHEAAFISGREGETGMVLLDHKDILTLPLPFLEQGVLKFPETFLNQIKNTFSRYVEEDRDRFRVAAIIIDPGHGGKDPGASWEHTVQGKTVKSVEKDITLKVARLLYSKLTTAYPDKRILMTREGDTNPTLDARVSIANSVPLGENEAAIYISIHANSSLNGSGRGYEVWYLPPNTRREVIDQAKYQDSREVLPILNSMMEEELTTESILLANYILKRIGEAVGKLIPSRGLKAEDWFVVKNARMPAVLVELGFVSNQTDALLMNDDAYLKNLSDALYKGINDFVVFFERAGGLAAIQ
jgi:N-acetylmuramoyl-L-alanine amidase